MESGERRMDRPFIEALLFQVKPDRVEAFEALIGEIRSAFEQQPGCIGARVMKRFYTFDGVAPGEPPRELTKIVKCVKYFAFFEFDNIERCGRANCIFFERYSKDVMKLLIMPFDINSGYAV